MHLHNRLLQALLYNASAPTLSAQSPALSNLGKRRRLGPNDPEFDTDDTRIEPKARVHSWVMGLTGKERMRVRRAVIGRGDEEDGEDGEEDDKKRKLSSFTPSKYSVRRAIELISSNIHASYRILRWGITILPPTLPPTLSAGQGIRLDTSPGRNCRNRRIPSSRNGQPYWRRHDLPSPLDRAR